MSAAIYAKNARERANIAAAMIRRGSTESRAFDNCFEMGDGTQVVAYIIAKAVADPRVAEYCRRAKWHVYSGGYAYDAETGNTVAETTAVAKDRLVGAISDTDDA